MASTIKRGFFNKFNRGEISPDAFAREDVPRIENSCETMENFMPQRLGPMSFRPGTEWMENDNTGVDDETILVPFVTSVDDPLILMFQYNGGVTPNFNVLRNHAFIESPAVPNTEWTNGDFSTNGFSSPGWSDEDEGSATTLIQSGTCRLTGTGTDSAKTNQITVNTDHLDPHMFMIKVIKGQCLCQIGEGLVDAAELFEQYLEVGEYRIEVTPSIIGDISITLSNANLYECVIQDCELITTAGSTAIQLASIGLSATDQGGTTYEQFRTLRWAQSADVMYFCGEWFLPFVIKRYQDRSWGIQRFINLFGPYDPINITPITMNPATIIGDNNIISSKGFFDASSPSSKWGFGNVDDSPGTLLKMAITGQTVTATGSDSNVETAGIFVFGTGDARQFVVNIDTTLAYNDVRLEKSFDEITWQSVKEYTGGGDIVDEIYDDNLDGAETFYRLQVEDIGSATNIILTLSYDYGTIEAEGRTTWRADNTQVNVAFYIPITVDQTVRDWYIGSWGGKHEWPTALAFHEGRLWFSGGNKVWGSESDFYESFDRLVEGNSASIEKTIGINASNAVHWLAPSARLVIGTPTSEIDVRSTTFGEVLTPLNTNLRSGSDLGTANVPPIVTDQEVIFVQRGGDKLIGIDFTSQTEKHDIIDFNILHPDIMEGANVVQMAVSRKPETRIWIVMDDGTMRVLLRDQTEDVLGWSRITVFKPSVGDPVADSVVSIAVIPGTDEDRIYISMDSGRIMRFAKLSEVGNLNGSFHFDAAERFVSPGTTIQLDASAGYLSGNDVGVWVDGVFDGVYTTNGSAQITGVTSGTDVVVGVQYSATYKSNKLTDFDDEGSLNARKRIMNTGLMMTDYVVGSLTIGPDAASLGNLPALEDNITPVNGSYDFFPFPFAGISETDPRVHIVATGPCKILALAYDVKDTARVTPQRG